MIAKHLVPLHDALADKVTKAPSAKAFLHFPFGDVCEEPLEIGKEGKVALPVEEVGAPPIMLVRYAQGVASFSLIFEEAEDRNVRLQEGL